MIAISDQVARRFTGQRGADRITVIPPVGPVPEVRFPPCTASELGAGQDAPLVVLVGRLHPQKDVGTLLQATVTVRERHPDLIVAVAGDGPRAGGRSLGRPAGWAWIPPFASSANATMPPT